jgi:hypothetical protein
MTPLGLAWLMAQPCRQTKRNTAYFYVTVLGQTFQALKPLAFFGKCPICAAPDSGGF